jgi:hypothetical protein
MDDSFAPPETVFGVDFSGARRAGDSIYVARGVVRDDRLHVEACDAAPALLGTGPDRDEVLPALRAFVADAGPRTAFAFDFPFGVPVALLDDADVDDWDDFVRWFPGHLTDADEYSAWGQTTVADSEQTYLPRATDEAVGAKSPYHFFVKAQAFYGIRDVLRPLVVADEARVVPMHAPDTSVPLVLEAYPAATLSALGLHRERYKTADEVGTERRRANVDGLAARTRVDVSAVRETTIADDEGDALDAVVAALTAFRNTRDGASMTPESDGWRREGHIYV